MDSLQQATNLQQYAVYIAPIIAAIITFLMNKYMQRKPRLIVYWGHIATHSMPFNNGYHIHSIQLQIKPTLALLNNKFSGQIPAIIKYNDEYWIYGIDSHGNSKLEKSNNPTFYKETEFKVDVPTLIESNDDIYNDILSSGAHQPKMYIGTHSIVIRNTGSLPANNIRVDHKHLPDYTILPSMDITVKSLSGNKKEMLIPRLIPGEQVTISYMYFSPTTCKDVNTDDIKYDEGRVKWIQVIPAPNLSNWQKALIYIVLFVGASSLIYMSILLAYKIYHCFNCI